MNKQSTAPRNKRLAAWSVHVYTAIGLVLALASVEALFQEDLRWLLLLMMAATFVDATDGTLARRIRVREVTPQFDGRKLDDIVDFLNFAFIPALAFFHLPLLPEGLSWVAVLPLLASGYGFCQDRAKTSDAFVGFPSYWNVLLAYFVMLPPHPWVALTLLVVLSALVWVPVHYVYPTKTAMWKPVTLTGGYLWAAIMVFLSIQLGEPWVPKVATLSLVYPLYYLVISLIHHRRVTRRGQTSTA